MSDDAKKQILLILELAAHMGGPGTCARDFYHTLILRLLDELERREVMIESLQIEISRAGKTTFI